MDDYYVCMKEGMDVCMPVDDDGRFYNGEEFGAGGPFSGMDTDEANPHIIQFLRDRGMLVAEVKITHSYPHCWRCKNPVLFRATDQWFVSMDKMCIRDRLDGDAVTLGYLLLFGEARFAVDGHGTRLNELRAGRA